jgi:hypothetical protein
LGGQLFEKPTFQVFSKRFNCGSWAVRADLAPRGGWSGNGGQGWPGTVNAEPALDVWVQ